MLVICSPEKLSYGEGRKEHAPRYTVQQQTPTKQTQAKTCVRTCSNLQETHACGVKNEIRMRGVRTGGTINVLCNTRIIYLVWHLRSSGRGQKRATSFIYYARTKCCSPRAYLFSTKPASVLKKKILSEDQQVKPHPDPYYSI